ncbi:MAG: hypothetical protein R3F30_07640 [Planctomycetota bacterium]
MGPRAIGPALACLALALRLLHSFRVPLPSNDGAGYLWMAGRLAEGDLAAGLGHAFHPGWPLLLAPGLAAGLDPFTAARLAGAATGALWVLLLWQLCRPRGLVPALAVATCAALSFDGVRLVAEAYSESPTLVLTAVALLLLKRGRVAWAGAVLGVGYWFRPEVLALLPLLWIPTATPRRRLAGAGLAVAGVATLALARLALCGRLEASPKLDVVLSHGPFGAAAAGERLALLGRNLLHLPYEGVQALDVVGLPFAVAGLVLLLRDRRRVGLLTLAALALGWAAMVATEVKPRFFLTQAPVLLPLAAAALARGGRAALVLFALGPLLAVARLDHDYRDPPRADRTAERALGAWLGERLAPADDLVTDLPRVAYYAGREPPPPRRWTEPLLRARIDGERPRFVVLGVRREGRAELAASLAAYRPLPAVLATLAEGGATGVERLGLYERTR